MDDNSNASPSGDDQDPPKYHSLVPVHTTDTSLASTIGKEASSLDVQDGENWLKLVLRDPSQERSVLDPSQDVSTPSIHPMMLSLQGLEGHMDDVPSHHTFLCFDVDGQHLIVKDMRERNNVDATDNDHWNAVLGRYESCTNTWSLQDLPRRQARLLYPHDRLYIGPLQRSSQDTTAWTLVLEHCYARTRPASPVPVAVVATHREQQAIENQHGGLLESQETYETDTGIEGTLTSASQTQTQSQDEFHGQNAAPWMLERLVGAQLLTQPGTQEDGPLSQEETDERGSKPSRSETGHREVASREDTKETQIIDDNKRNTQQSKQSNCPIGRKEEEDDDETVDPDEITGLKPETDPPETENAANVCENVTNAKSSTDDAAAKNIRFSAEKVMTSPKSQSLPNSASRLERVRPTHMQKASVEAQTDSFATRKEQSFISQVASAETVKPAELAKLSDTPETVQSPVREAPDTNLMAHSGTRGLQVEAEPLTVDESQAEIVNGALSNGSKLGHTPVNDKNCVDKETARELTAGSLSAAIAGGTSGNRSSFTSPDKSCNSVALMSPAQSSGQRSCMSPESVSVLSVINTPGSVPQSKSRGLIKSLISTIEARQPSQETQSKDVFTCEDAEVNIKSTTSERDDDRTEMSPMIDRADEKKIGDVGCETARAEKPAKSLTSETHNPGTNGDIENDETIEESRTRKRPLRKSRRLSDTSTEENESPANITRSVRKKLKTTPALSVKRSNRMDTKEPVRVAVTTIELTTKQRNMIKQIGGEFLNDVSDAHRATHIIASDGSQSIKRTPKLMIAICKGAKVVNLDWLIRSARAKEPLPSEEFLILNDLEAEAKYGFLMRETLNTAKRLSESNKGFLDGLSLHVCEGVAGNGAPSKKEMKLIIEAAGGHWISNLDTIQGKERPEEIIIISSVDPKEAKRQLKRISVAAAQRRGALCKTTAWLFRSVMMQQI